MEIIFCETPGHGYLIVDAETLKGIGFDIPTPECVRKRMADDGTVLYALEEDEQAPAFVEHCKARGVDVSIECVSQSYADSFLNWKPHGLIKHWAWGV